MMSWWCHKILVFCFAVTSSWMNYSAPSWLIKTNIQPFFTGTMFLIASYRKWLPLVRSHSRGPNRRSAKVPWNTSISMSSSVVLTRRYPVIFVYIWWPNFSDFELRHKSYQLSTVKLKLLFSTLSNTRTPLVLSSTLYSQLFQIHELLLFCFLKLW